MIKVTINKEDSKIKKIHMHGHAKSAEFGKDIVCASASSITITSINACLSIDEDSIVYTENDGYLIIEIKSDSEIIKKIIYNMINMLKELEIDYPNNIKIREEE